MAMKARPAMIEMTPRMMPAVATPPLLASPLLTRLRPMKPRITATIPNTMPPTTETELISAMIATTNAATPMPFFAGTDG